MPTPATIQTVALSIFGFVALAVVTALISANVRRWANEKGHDAYLLTLWDILPGWGRKLLSGWQPLRQLWWLWLCLGLSGGLGISLSLLAETPSSPDVLEKAVTEAKAHQSAEDQDAAHKAMAEKDTAEHNLGKQQDAPANAKAIIDVSPDFLMDLYNDKTGTQGDAAAALYIGKRYRASGSVHNVVNLSTGYTIVFLSANNKRTISLQFQGKDRDIVASYPINHTITALCQIAKIDKVGLDLSKCELQ